MTGTVLAAALHTHASGIYCLEAAAELLIAHRVWLSRADFTEFITIAGDRGDRPQASIDWPAAINALTAGRLPCSGSETRILLIAASLAHGTPVALNDVLTGLDSANAGLIAQAVDHATNRTPNPETR